MFVGALGALVSVFVYGFLAWVIVRWILRRRSWNYLRATLSPVVLSLMLLAMFGLPATRAGDENRDDAPTEATLQALDDEQSPDPVGKKLAGQSDQVTEADAERMIRHAQDGNRFDILIGKTLRDYRDQSITGPAWIRSSRSRHAQADQALARMTDRAQQVTDTEVQREMTTYDEIRADLLAAFNRLVRVVDAGQVRQERRTQNLVDRSLAAFHKANSRLRDMMEPYMTDRQRRQLRKAERAARDAVS